MWTQVHSSKMIVRDGHGLWPVIVQTWLLLSPRVRFCAAAAGCAYSVASLCRLSAEISSIVTYQYSISMLCFPREPAYTYAAAASVTWLPDCVVLALWLTPQA